MCFLVHIYFELQSLNHDCTYLLLLSQADLLEKNQVTGAFVCGTAGEGTSLTIAERKQVVAKWVEASKGRIKIIAHIGTNWYD